MSPDLPWTVSVSFCCLCHGTGVSKLLIWATRLGPQIHFGRSAASQNKHCSGCERGHGRSALAKGPRRNLTFKMSIRSKALGSQSCWDAKAAAEMGTLAACKMQQPAGALPEEGCRICQICWAGRAPSHPPSALFSLGFIHSSFPSVIPPPPKKVPLPTLRIYNDTEKGE